MRRFVTLRSGVVASSEAVFVRAHSPRRRAVPVGLPVSDPSPATELSMNSVPLASLAYWLAGDVAGQTVKPGVPARLRLGTRVTPTVAGCSESWRFENAYTWAALKFGPKRSYSFV